MKLSALIHSVALLRQFICSKSGLGQTTSHLNDSRSVAQSSATAWVIPKLSIISWNSVRATCGGGIFNPEPVTRNSGDTASKDRGRRIYNDILQVFHHRHQKDNPANVQFVVFMSFWVLEKKYLKKIIPTTKLCHRKKNTRIPILA